MNAPVDIIVHSSMHILPIKGENKENKIKKEKVNVVFV